MHLAYNWHDQYNQLCGDLVSKPYSANSNTKKIEQIIIHMKTVSRITN